MENEQLTFIVPAYNAENTLATTLDSIVRQISPSWRIIIVNDGSTDKTEDIAQEYVRKYPRKVRYLYQQNKGLGGARNSGMDLADTAYISFLDSDDWIKADYVKNIVDQIQKCDKEKP